MLKAISSRAARKRGASSRLYRVLDRVDFRHFAGLTIVATYALIVLGGVVRTSEAGLGCPDWPRCHGEFIPPLEKDVLIEYSHRLLAMTVGFLILGTAIAAWVWHRRRRMVAVPAVIALLLLGPQVGLGAVTVTSELSAELVTAHLAVAMALFAALIVAGVHAFSDEERARPAWSSTSTFPALALFALLATYGLILTGSYVTGSKAGLAFTDWPLFNGKLIADGGRLAQVQFLHRIAAAVVGVVIVYVAVRAWRTERKLNVITVSAITGAVLYGAQVMVGATAIWTMLEPAVAAAHLALASAVWAALVVLTTTAYLGPQMVPLREHVRELARGEG
jgi:heme A synthase